METKGAAANGHGIGFGEALRVWVRVAALSFGGPAGQIATMHRILVEEKRWISEGRFLHALNYCMLLPGPEAQQLATYIGWLLHRSLGGLVAGTLFVLPGFLSILTLSILYAVYQGSGIVEGLFFGLKPAVMAVVIEAVIRLGRRALKTTAMMALAAASFVAIFFLQVPFPWIVLGAGLAGWIGGRAYPQVFPALATHGTAALDDGLRSHARPGLGRSLRVAALWGTLWFAPLVALTLIVGPGDVLVQEGVFFSKAAVVTFGGAYSVLSYVAQQAVENYGWLRPGEMLDGLGMAETTPGPLIQVVQFVGFMGAYRNPGGIDPVAAGILGSIVTTWVTFVPCFLWIFLGAPYIEYLRGNVVLTTALSAITAAVVGAVLNLGIWFGLHTLFAELEAVERFGVRVLLPEWSSFDPASALLMAAACLAIFRFKLGMIPTLVGSVVVGATYRFFLHP